MQQVEHRMIEALPNPVLPTYEADLLPQLRVACIDEAELLRKKMTEVGIEETKPFGAYPVPEYEKQVSFKVRLMDAHDYHGYMSVNGFLGKPVGIYQINPAGEASFFAGIDIAGRQITSKYEFYVARRMGWKPRVDSDDVTYIRTLIQDASLVI